MKNIRKDLISEELERDINEGYTYHKFNLHNSLISKLYNHYDCIEMCENFYDSEPNYDDETFNMYMDYSDYIQSNTDLFNVIVNSNEIKEQENFRFSKEPHTKEELKAAYNTIMKQREEYEPRRIEFCSWQEPYFKGNWGYSQKFVNDVASETLEEIKKNCRGNKDRLYIADKDNQIRIYWYGRDIKKVDYWFIFERKEKY